ncbi:MAG: L-serine ammonia-lyase, partial [Myxococcales bacterium]|nr:L-serine ammonia-lyase [Myxococcales bacterium]
MHFGVFDLFKIGIGPSSSHTVGPMVAARAFLVRVDEEHGIDAVDTVQAELYGSLALTGPGHGTDKAVILGLEGAKPDTLDPDDAEKRLHAARDNKRINLLGKKTVSLDPSNDVKMKGET